MIYIHVKKKKMSYISFRFMTYSHLIAFWKLIEPASHNMIRVSRARATTIRSEAGTTGSAWVNKEIEEQNLTLHFQWKQHIICK